MKFKYIIWDWNGTLVDDVELSVQIFNSMCAKYGIEQISVETYKRNFKFPVSKFYEERGYDFTKIDFETVGRYYVTNYDRLSRSCSLHGGAEDAMRSLKAVGCSQSILSAYEQNYLFKAVDNFGIRKYLDNIFGLDDIVATSKISRGKALMEKLGADPSEAVMVGDTDHDKAVADALGISCALVALGHNHADNLARLGAPVFASHAELLKFLKY